MDQILLFALLGLGTGALIAGIGLGVVLSYRGSGVINVATGAYAMVAGYLFYWLRDMATVPALVLALGATVALGVAVERPGAADRLAAAGIRASTRAGAARLAFHLHNTDDDVDRALAAL